MSWTNVYLICFFVGIGFSIVSLLAGGAHLHLPHMHIKGGVGPLNFGTIAAFLAWFGGTGYLLSTYGTIWYLIALPVAFFSGLGGASIVFLFLAKVLTHEDEALDPADYDMVGVLGTVSSSIRPAGTGEMIFSQAGVRRAAPARSEDEAAIPNGTEVVVTRYQHGIAYVRPWEELENKAARAKEMA